MKTYYAKPNEVEREWVLIELRTRFSVASLPSRSDSQGQAQAAVHAARHTGDFVVIINADKIRVTGTKAQSKSYYRHSGFPGG